MVGRGANDPEFVVLSYNVHNLFDDRYDGTEFAGYRPDRDRWGIVEFHTKAERTAEAILIAGSYPEILALQEIENEHALSVLLEQYLPRARYRWYVMPPVQHTRHPSAFRVALATRYPIIESRVHAFFIDEKNLRDVLEVGVSVRGLPLRLFVNHWPSRRGGAERTEPERLFVATSIRRRLDDLLESEPDAAVIITGDLNMEPHEFVTSAVFDITDRRDAMFITANRGDGDAAAGSTGRLYNGWAEETFPGSYWFRGDWSRIDQMLFSAGAVGRTVSDSDEGGRPATGFLLNEFSVITDDRLLGPDGAPRAWRAGSTWGYSDHLPIRARITRHLPR